MEVKVTLYAPDGDTDEALRKHAEKVAETLKLDFDQAVNLASELRNAISPIVLILNGVELTPEDRADATVALRRVMAVTDALVRRAL